MIVLQSNGCTGKILQVKIQTKAVGKRKNNTFPVSQSFRLYFFYFSSQLLSLSRLS